eukprot:scaffold92941_cov72-Phaeocystis_antarctica.AAC.1
MISRRGSVAPDRPSPTSACEPVMRGGAWRTHQSSATADDCCTAISRSSSYSTLLGSRLNFLAALGCARDVDDVPAPAPAPTGRLPFALADAALAAPLRAPAPRPGGGGPCSLGAAASSSSSSSS